MFLIFGIDHRTSYEKKGKQIRHCWHCNNERFWIYRKITNWFSLFFIPIIPLKTRYNCACPVCGTSEIISKQEFDNE